MNSFKKFNWADAFIVIMLIAAMCWMFYNITDADAQPVGRSAQISWGAVTTDVEGTIITGVTYNVYAGTKGSTTKTKIKDSLSVLTYTADNLPPGETCFQMTASARGVEGGPSVEGCKSFPFPAPSSGGKPLTVQ